MKVRFAVFAVLGVALALYLVMHVGWRAVLSAGIAVGWGGFALLCVYALAITLLQGAAWHVLLPGTSVSGPWVFIRARMVRDAAAEVLPFSQFGGMALGVRTAILLGVSSALACASMIVDVTTEMVAQLAYLAVAVAILMVRAPQGPLAASLLSVSVGVLVAAAIAAGLFMALQRYAQQITAALSARLLRGAGQMATAIGAAFAAIYRAPARVAFSAALHFSAWILNGFGAWIAFRLIGAHVDLLAVIAIESFMYAARSAAPIVPNALGVQEAAYAFLAPLFGVGAELALGVSLVKRARDIAIGVPVLLIWQAAESRRALAESQVLADSGAALRAGAPSSAWLRSAVLALDRHLRQRQGVYEYSLHPQCLFRLQLARAEDTLVFADGTSVRPGSPVLALHLWNERVPVMGHAGPTLAWARRTDRAIHASLRELAWHLEAQPSLKDISAICADMRVTGRAQAERFARLMAHYGFEAASDIDPRSRLHRLGDAILIIMLVLATNPRAIRTSVLRHRNKRIIVSRAALEHRYAAVRVSVRA